MGVDSAAGSGAGSAVAAAGSHAAAAAGSQAVLRQPEAANVWLVNTPEIVSAIPAKSVIRFMIIPINQ